MSFMNKESSRVIMNQARFRNNLLKKGLKKIKEGIPNNTITALHYLEKLKGHI